MAVPSPLEAPADEPAPSSSQHLKTELLRRIAHDIASPTGVTMTVLDELTTASEPRPELVAMARRSLRRLLRLSEQLALVAELESGAFEPTLAELDLCALAKQAMEDARAIDGRREVTAALVLETEPLVVRGDSRLLLTVVRELVGNALKVASSRVVVSLGAVDGAVELRVEDDGPGFSPGSASTFGQRFVKRASARGLGLSLSMAIQILRVHGGTLEIDESTLPPGRRDVVGAAVVLTLP